jgi:predicted transposase/invertase (TIGR01784 family)
VFYWARLYASQLKKGQYYKDLFPVVAINILGFNLFKNDDRCQRYFLLKDAETNEEYLDIHFVELTKRKYVDQNDKLWAWVEFLKTPNSGYMELL